MQQFPMTITAAANFSDSLKPLLTELEMWLNFQALKADWYSNEAHVLQFDFCLVRSLDEAMVQQGRETDRSRWVVAGGYAYLFEVKNLHTKAYIAVDDLLKSGTGIEREIKTRLLAVANAVAVEHDLLKLSL
ncbi:hypothetical protein TUM4438_32750 [Shewanella sairae]|uniref:Uncharacterized protein n=1 Tax=Shewanella sairae TaxID=190310 RepID=A0ABQ4PM99_9GAMM|nr:hypothetical protein [Shewanella sairae]MCL1129979.1 hypothetical protein [Shewanella sairae]GIU49347.1 hypothetical protein TUM4438_32750 [Shewanella sairae]